MKSIKMFGKKIPILFVFLAMVLLVGTAAIAAPANAEIKSQTVTGETVTGYTVTVTVPFGQMSQNSDKEITSVITATYDANIDVSVANTLVTYTTGVLTKLEYDVLGSLKCTITAPASSGVQTYTVNPTTFSLTNGDVVDLTAYTGTVAGVWDPVVITLTITPT